MDNRINVGLFPQQDQWSLHYIQFLFMMDDLPLE